MTRRLAPLLVVLPVLLAAAGCSDDDAPERRTAPIPVGVTDTRFVGLGGASPLVGLADNRPETLGDRRFAFTQIKRVRVTVPFDDVVTPARVGVQDAWFAAARANGIEPLVSFYRSVNAPSALPSVATYARDVAAFRKRYPWVRNFSSWSEPNFSVQPTSRDPRRAAAYTRALERQCATAKPRCTAVAGDYRLDASARSARWLRTYLRALGSGSRTWGLSIFEDTRRRSTTLTRDFLRRTRGPVWVDEAGGERPRRAGGFRTQRRQIAFLADRYARVSGRIKRIYVYNWRAVPGGKSFDSALLNADGTPRPAYRELNRGIGRLTPRP